MKFPIGLVVSFVAGVAAGIGCTYKYFDRLHRDRADEEIESVKAKLANRQPVVYKHGDDQNAERPIFGIDVSNGPNVSCDKKQNAKGPVIDDRLISSTVVDDEYPVIDSTDERLSPNDERDKEGVPYLISEDEYYNDRDFDKDTLTYYEGDDTLADTRDERVDDVKYTIGDALDSFGDDTYIYVRNPRLGMDFEIQCMEQSYQEAIYGYIPPSGRNTKKARERAKKAGDQNEGE